VTTTPHTPTPAPSAQEVEAMRALVAHDSRTPAIDTLRAYLARVDAAATQPPVRLYIATVPIDVLGDLHRVLIHAGLMVGTIDKGYSTARVYFSGRLTDSARGDLRAATYGAVEISEAPADDGCVDVRIAVAISERGEPENWTVLFPGYSEESELRMLASQSPRCRVSIVTARVPRPAPPVEVRGEVSDAAGEGEGGVA